MPDLVTIIFTVEIITLLIVILFSFKTLKSYRNIDNSFAKLGYIIREDSKKYFHEIGVKMIEDNKTAEEQNKQMITEALIQAVAKQNEQSSEVIKQTNDDIQKTISKARQTARDIIKQAEDQSGEINEKIMKNMTLIVEKVISEYVDEHYGADDREKIILTGLKGVDLK